MSGHTPPIPERPPTPTPTAAGRRAAGNPWKTATFCLAAALVATSATLVYTVVDDRDDSGGTAAAEPSPSIWQDDRPRTVPERKRKPVESVSPSPGPGPGFEVGEQARSGGVVVTIGKVRETGSIVFAGTARKAGSGAKYVVLETVVFNDTKGGMDLTCGLPIVNSLLDAGGRRYDTVDDLDEVPGNPECNEQLQPGFKDSMHFVYRVPEDAEITAWEFSEYDLDPDRKPSIVRIGGDLV
ncbi:hypothetical protein [Streptomyces sp. NPDC058953]|uniref:hypothetical protein n=1 Tax=unclassified Streptomyces TaxID=2593676 RepID=UPI0036BD9821